jgi:hypothetical protein
MSATPLTGSRFELFPKCLSAFIQQAQNNLRFNESLNVMLANAEHLFPANHAERLFVRLGLDDLEATRGRPPRKGAAKAQKGYLQRKSPGKKSAKK